MREGQTHIRSQTAWVAFLDALCLAAGGVFGVLMRLDGAERGEYVFAHIDGLLIFSGSIILANYLAGSYRLQQTFSRFNLFVTWAFSLVFALLVLSTTSYAWFRMLLGRGVLGYMLAGYSVLSLALKLLVYRSLFRTGLFLCRTAIVGTGARSLQIRKLVENKYVMPAHKVVAHIVGGKGETGHHDRLDMLDGVPVLRVEDEDFHTTVSSLDVRLIVIALDDMRRVSSLYSQLRRLRFKGVEVMNSLIATETYSGSTPLDLLTEDHVMQLGLESEMPSVRRSKRLFDIVLSLALCVVFLPVGLAIALLIKLLEPRAPVLYYQDRVGQFGQVFRVYKFRTMKVNAEEGTGPIWSAHDDPRITPLGRFLRSSRLDEIPQFWNILEGNMSVVGPRPERPELVAMLEKEIQYYSERENVVPGLTGWAQIRYPYGNSVDDARRKLEYDLYYIKHQSLGLDIQIVLNTIQTMLLGNDRNRP